MPEVTVRRVVTRRCWCWCFVAACFVVLAVASGFLCVLIILPLNSAREVASRCHRYEVAYGEMDECFLTAAVQQLGGGTQAVGKLRLYLSMPDSVAAHKGVAVRLLAGCGSSAGPVLNELLDHRSSSIRALAALELSEFPSVFASAKLQSLAAQDPDPLVRWMCVRALAADDSGVHVDVFLRALEDPDGRVRLAAVSALSQVGTTRTIPQLLGLLDDENMMVAQAAREALEKIKKAQQEKQAKDKQPAEAPAK